MKNMMRVAYFAIFMSFIQSEVHSMSECYTDRSSMGEQWIAFNRTSASGHRQRVEIKGTPLLSNGGLTIKPGSGISVKPLDGHPVTMDDVMDAIREHASNKKPTLGRETTHKKSALKWKALRKKKAERNAKRLAERNAKRLAERNTKRLARPFRNEVHQGAKQSDLPQRPLEVF